MAVEVASRYLPADMDHGVGGDWFDVIPLSGARVALVVGDVVGHGINAAATMGRLRTAVRTLADMELPPDELLAHLDDTVQRLAEEDADAPGPDPRGGGRHLSVCRLRPGHPAVHHGSGPGTRRPRSSTRRAGSPSPTFPPEPRSASAWGSPSSAVELELPEGSRPRPVHRRPDRDPRPRHRRGNAPPGRRPGTAGPIPGRPVRHRAMETLPDSGAVRRRHACSSSGPAHSTRPRSPPGHCPDGPSAVRRARIWPRVS